MHFIAFTLIVVTVLAVLAHPKEAFGIVVMLALIAFGLHLVGNDSDYVDATKDRAGRGAPRSRP